jgi:hypothetical protein
MIAKCTLRPGVRRAAACILRRLSCQVLLMLSRFVDDIAHVRLVAATIRG